MTNVIVIIEIMKEVNMKIFTMWLEKKFLLDVSDFFACLCCKSKISLLLMYSFMKSFNFVSVCLNELSKFCILRFRGKGCSHLVLSLIIGNESVRLGSMSR